MPLLDHFHPPLYPGRSWTSFHAGWSVEIMAQLNRGLLPQGYFAEAQVEVGGVEVDVGSLHDREPESLAAESENGGVAVLTEAPATVLTIPAVFPDDIEVRVFETSGGLTLVGAIELVSPGNKDREEPARCAFAAKCAAYLQAGVGLLIIDMVTSRRANMHDELIDLLHHETALCFPGGAPLYAVAYRPLRTGPAGDRIEARCATLAVGQMLPTMPFSLRRGPTVTMDLEATYMETRLRSQL